MGIRGNFSRDTMSVARFIGGGALSLTVDNRMCSQTWKASLMHSGDTEAQRLVSQPSGYYPPGTWRMPIKTGAISARNAAAGVAAWTGAIADGRALAGAFAGVASFTATGQLVVSGQGAFAGSSSFTGNIIAALAASGSTSGVAAFTATPTAIGHMSGSFAGSASFAATRYATGALSGSFTPAVALEAAAFSAYLLDEEDIETGMTLRQAMRLIAAATAGKVSGGGTTTITFKSAVADADNRIVATVDNDGNRTAITYDLE